MISLLIPVTDIDETISCMVSAANLAKQNIEFILMFSNNDTDTLSRISELPEFPIRLMSCGDIQLYEKVNAMSRVASGNVLMYWNEKNRFLTRDYDVKLNIGGVFIGQTATVSSFMPREMYSILGHYALHNQVNDYLVCLGHNLGMVHNVDVANTVERTEDPTFDCDATKVLIGNDVALVRMALEKTTD